MFSDYDQWKLATPPEYDWPAGVCEDCGIPFFADGSCGCQLDEPAGDDYADEIDEMQGADR